MGDFFMRVPRPTERPTNPLCLLICHEKSCGTFRNCAIFLGRTHPELRTFTHSSSAVRNGFFFSRGGRYLGYRRLFFLPLPLALLVWDPFFMTIFLTDGRLLLVAWVPKSVGSFGDLLWSLFLVSISKKCVRETKMYVYLSS